ncbi:lysosome-associated membrane glycoprotein 3 [Echinops telfairi]|uniref:Lysosome-associated membrane glycoprotein 3 n=1 Tax=Echinops telfairi TaxID=9371 RepID=A0ABM0ZRV9_ECHTE|nr:lysosome-associated membrane glycoprotein 3 [Echinops telfairi]
MPAHLPATLVLLGTLAVIFQDGSQANAKPFPETGDDREPTTAATVQARLALLPSTSRAPPNTVAARATGTPPASASKSEDPATHPIKTPAPLMSAATEFSSPSPLIYTLFTAQAPSNTSQLVPPVSEATIRPSATPHSQAPTTPPPTHTSVTSPATVSHTPGGTTHTRNQTTHACNCTTSPMPSQPTHVPGTTPGTHNATPTAHPTPSAPAPTLTPQPSPAQTGIYEVLNGSRLCVKAVLGLQLSVQDQETALSPQKYFNLNPNVTHASGNCGARKSNLLLNFQGGFVNITFTKDENSYYISGMGASLTVSNPERTYQGMQSAMVWFEAMVGHSFKCVSEQSIKLSPLLQLKTMNVQLQAFDFEADNFGNVDECSSDYTVVLPVIGTVVLSLCAVGLIVYGIRLSRKSSGYQRI